MCSICERKCNEEIYFCYGCEAVICPKCNKNDELVGRHEQEDHLFEPDELDELGWE